MRRSRLIQFPYNRRSKTHVQAKLSRRESSVGHGDDAGVPFPIPLSGGPAATTPPRPAAPSKLGAQFIGKLEGPEIIRDVAKFPKTFKEAPALAGGWSRAGQAPAGRERLAGA